MPADLLTPLSVYLKLSAESKNSFLLESVEGGKSLARYSFIGADPDAMSDEQFRTATARHFVGTPDDVAADLQRRILDPGIDGVIVNLLPNGHQPGVVTMVGEMLAKLVR